MIPFKLKRRQIVLNNILSVIGSQLQTVTELDIQKFKTVEAEDLPDINSNDLSSDQKYMYKIYNVVKSGIVPVGFKDLQPGTLIRVAG